MLCLKMAWFTIWVGAEKYIFSHDHVCSSYEKNNTKAYIKTAVDSPRPFS